MPEVCYIAVPRVDDGVVSYPRPSAMEIAGAHSALRRLDASGQLDTAIVEHVRVLLAVVGRFGAESMLEAFPLPRPALRVVEARP